MRELIEKIYRRAQAIGACSLFTGKETLEELVSLMFRPQGIEFMLQHKFPDLDTLREFKPYHPERFGVYIDCGEIDLTETKAIISELQEKGIELINLTIGNPYLIPHTNRPYAVKAPEDGNIGMKRVYDVTKEITSAFPDMKFVVSALTYPGEDAIDYAEKLLSEGVGDIAGFGRMTFAYPEFYKEVYFHQSDFLSLMP